MASWAFSRSLVRWVLANFAAWLNRCEPHRSPASIRIEQLRQRAESDVVLILGHAQVQRSDLRPLAAQFGRGEHLAPGMTLDPRAGQARRRGPCCRPARPGRAEAQPRGRASRPTGGSPARPRPRLNRSNRSTRRSRAPPAVPRPPVAERDRSYRRSRPIRRSLRASCRATY